MSEQWQSVLHPGVVLDSWEKRMLQHVLENGQVGGYGWPALLAESIALRSKYASEIEAIEQLELTTPELPIEQREQLTIDAAIGLAILQDLQRIIDQTVLTGDMAEAKRLTNFRNKLAQTVKEIKELIGADAYREAELMHHIMVVPPEELSREKIEADPEPETDEPKVEQPIPAIEEPDEGPPQQIRMDRSSDQKLGRILEVKKDHSKYLIIALAVVLLAWSILVLPRFFRKPLPELGLADLPQSSATKTISVRPPSLYVVVDGKEWRAMPSKQRLQWVEEVGGIAAGAGYTGVHVRTNKDTSVAQWLKHKGAKLVATSKEGS
jgi:hypothetical protein